MLLKDNIQRLLKYFVTKYHTFILKTGQIGVLIRNTRMSVIYSAVDSTEVSYWQTFIFILSCVIRCGKMIDQRTKPNLLESNLLSNIPLFRKAYKRGERVNTKQNWPFRLVCRSNSWWLRYELLIKRSNRWLKEIS